MAQPRFKPSLQLSSLACPRVGVGGGGGGGRGDPNSLSEIPPGISPNAILREAQRFTPTAYYTWTFKPHRMRALDPKLPKPTTSEIKIPTAPEARTVDDTNPALP